MASQEHYIVSARKYRPATFQTVVGQKALTATLKNAIKGNKLAQAYLFCGPRGVGKTSCARIFAKTINCLNPTADGEACGECESCKAIDRGSSFNLVELDAASNNSVDDIRDITEQVNIPAQDGRYRVFIIDEVHMLSNNAFNAFLKTLEEPPKNVVFILATTERHKVIPTILSRCQVYDFRRITVNDIIDHLQYVAQSEGVNAEREALSVIAQKADGAMRDALSIFDQVAASTHGNVTYRGTVDALNVLDQDYYFRLVDIFRQGDVASALLLFKEITDKGFDAQFFLNGLAGHIRNLMVSADPRTIKLLETTEEWEHRYVEQAPLLPIEWYYTAIKLLNDADFNYKTSGNKRLLVELTLIRLSRLMSARGEESSPFVAPGAHKPQVVPEQKSEANKGAAFPTVTQQPKGEPKPSTPVSAAPSYGSSSPSTSSGSASTFVSSGSPSATPASGQGDQSPKRRSVTSRPTSFRLTSNETKGSVVGETGPRKSAYSEEQFKVAWEGYASSHPDQRILTGAMRACVPVKEETGVYRVMVDHPAQKQAFESSINELLEYLKNRLDNDELRLIIDVSEKEEDQKKLNSKDFLKMVVEENHVIAKFLKDIDAELE